MSVVEFSTQETVSFAASELSDLLWSVVSFEKCEAAGLSYVDAVAKLDELDQKRIAGLCIVTNVAAARLKTPE